MRTGSNSLKHDRWKRRLQVAVIFFCGFAVLASAQAVKHQVTRRVLARTHGKKATLPQLYEFFFVFADHVESRSIADTERGFDRTFYRQHLQKESGLTTAEYSPVLESAKRFAAVNVSVRKQIAEEEKAFKELHITSVTDSRIAQHRAQVKSLMEHWSSTLQSEITNVHTALGEAEAGEFEIYLQTKYIMGQVGPALPGTNVLPQTTGKHRVAPDDIPYGGNLTYSDPFSLDDDSGSWGTWEIGAEARISYLGSPTSSSTEFYAYMTWDLSNVIGDGLIDPYSIEGDFYVDGAFDPNLTCYLDNSVDCDGGASGYVELTSPSGTEYTWDSTGSATLSFDFNCLNDGGETDYCSADSEDYAEEASVVIYYPDINSVSPASFPQGTTGTFTIDGQYLESAFENPPTVTVTNQSSLFSTFDVTPPSTYPDGDITVHYTVADNATPGTYTLTVNNGFGSDTYDITIPVPPAITGISVAGVANGPLQANTTQTVTLTGTNFGTAAPTISAATDGEYVTVGAVSAHSATSVTFTATTALLAPTGTASFKLVATNGSAISPSVAVLPVVLPAPQIMMFPTVAGQQSCTAGGTQVDGTTTYVFAGQQILLCPAFPNLPVGATVTSSTWSPQDPTDLVGGFCAPLGVPPAAVLPCANPAFGGPLPSPPMSGPGVTNVAFYWIVPDTLETLTYSYCINNSTTCATSAVATFDISGPTGNLLPSISLAAGNLSTYIPSATDNPATMQMGNAPIVVGLPQIGVLVYDTAVLPQGSFTWVQIINSTTYNEIQPDPPIFTAPNLGLGLDGGYPYPSTTAPHLSPYLNNAASDGPGSGSALFSGIGEFAEQFDATMYVMWDPAIPPVGQNACQTASVNTTQTPYIYVPSTCASIPIPLGSVEYKWSGCAINALAAAGTSNFKPSWFVQCGQTLAEPSLANGYPQWNACDKSLNGSCKSQ